MGRNTVTLLQRTKKGQAEVQHKTHVLTQSERMLMVLIDGITPTKELQQKLRGMIDRRFTLVIADLTARGLIEKSPPGNQKPEQEPEKLDTLTIERFIRQDPLDPVTITALYLEPELARVGKKEVVNDVPPKENIPAQPDLPVDHSAEVDFYLPLEEQQSGKQFVLPERQEVISPIASNAEWRGSSRRRMRRWRRSRQLQIGYGLLFVGLVCVVIWLVIKMSH